MTTRTATIFPIVGALKSAHEFKDQARGDWKAKTPEQEKFLERMKSCMEGLDKFSDEELKFLASFSHTEINEWLADNGFTIALDAFEDPTDFGAASIQDVKVEWKEEGIPQDIVLHELEQVVYPGVALSENCVTVKFAPDKYFSPVAYVQTKNGDVVMMALSDNKERDGLELLDHVKFIADATQGYCYGKYDGVVFPMIDCDDKPNIDFLLGMGFNAQSAVTGETGFAKIKQALQQTYFKMNETGARVKSAVAISMTLESCSMPRPPFVIDKPFYISITRPGVDVPYFAAYLDQDTWKNPGSLKMPGDKEEDEEG